MNQIVRPRRTAWKKSRVSLKKSVKICSSFVVQKHYLRAKMYAVAGLISYLFHFSTREEKIASRSKVLLLASTVSVLDDHTLFSSLFWRDV